MDAYFRMDRTERIYKIDPLIRERGVENMRSRHHAPIEWDRSTTLRRTGSTSIICDGGWKMATSSKPELTAIDWSLTTWEGARREQMQRWSELPLERIILALEEMEDLAKRLSAPQGRVGE